MAGFKARSDDAPRRSPRPARRARPWTWVRCSARRGGSASSTRCARPPCSPSAPPRCRLRETHDDHLRYVAASGAGAESIVGTELGLADGLAGFVAASGQAMVIDQPANDPRFARDVAERTGYVPDSMLLVPVDDVDRHGRRGARRCSTAPSRRPTPSALGSAFAALAAEPFLAAADADQTARALTAAFVDAYAAGDPRLSTAIRRAVRRSRTRLGSRRTGSDTQRPAPARPDDVPAADHRDR